MMDDTAERICLPRLPAFKENTFCVDQADSATVEYVRADLHQKALDRIEALEATLKRLEYWFDTDEEVLDAMTPDERADHMRQLQMIRDTL